MEFISKQAGRYKDELDGDMPLDETQTSTKTLGYGIRKSYQNRLTGFHEGTYVVNLNQHVYKGTRRM